MGGRRWAPDQMVRVVQWAMAGAAVLFIGGVVAWISHLIRTAWRLRDVPSASIGISLVAIPVFLTLLGVILYVFWGLLGDRDQPKSPAPVRVPPRAPVADGGGS